MTTLISLNQFTPMTPVTVPCPKCGGEMVQHPSGRIYGCSDCGEIVTADFIHEWEQALAWVAEFQEAVAQLPDPFDFMNLRPSILPKAQTWAEAMEQREKDFNRRYYGNKDGLPFFKSGATAQPALATQRINQPKLIELKRKTK